MDFDFYNRREYFEQLASEVAACREGERVLVATMSMDSLEPHVKQLLDSLTSAALQGADVTLIVDAYTFLTHPNKLPGPLWYHTELPAHMAEPFQSYQQTIRNLGEAGVRVAMTNAPKRRFSFRSGGRSHIKAGIVNDKLYIGGCNLQSTDTLDVMAAWHDSAAADWVYRQLDKLATRGTNQLAFGNKDRTYSMNPQAKLLVDAGKRSQSRILQQAHRLIDSAREHIFLTCQYFPGGETGRHLQAAHKRGVQVDIVYSHPSVHGLEAPAHAVYEFLESTQLPRSFFSGQLPKGAPKLHAKVLCSEKSAMVGSHNYVTQGVSFGTAEIALQVDEPVFSHDLKKFMLAQLA